MDDPPSWRARATEINVLHKEHQTMQNTAEETDERETAEDVYRYRRKQAILNSDGTRREAVEDSKFSQVFKGLDLKSVNRVNKPSANSPAEPFTTDPSAGDGTRDQGPEHGRRRYQSRSTHKDAKKSVEIIIPLGNDRLKAVQIHKDKALRAEYAARYLEKLGVSPTPQNMQLIWKYMPLEQCTIQQVFHPGLSKHEKRNYIVIRPNQKQLKSDPSYHDIQHIPFEVLPDNLLGPKESSHREYRPQGDANDEDGHRLRSFADYKQSYIFPYNLGARYLRSKARTSPPTSARRGRPKEGSGRPAKGDSGGTKDAGEEHSPSTEGDHKGGREEEGEDDEEDREDRPVNEEEGRSLPVGRSVEAALTAERLRLQDGLLSITKQKQNTDLDSAEKRKDIEQRVAAGDLTALEDHPDMDEADCILMTEPETATPPKPGVTTPTHASYDPGASRRVLNENELILKELDLPPKLTEDQTRGLFKNFVDEFPFNKYWPSDSETARQGGDDDGTRTKASGRTVLAQGGVRKTKQLTTSSVSQRLTEQLQGPLCVEFEMKLVHLFYWSLIAPMTTMNSGRREAHSFDDRFVDIYRDMLLLLRPKGGSKSLSLAPLVLLAVRVVTEAVFNSSYPMWGATPKGAATIREMNNMITQLLDPLDYLTHISVIESSPQALKVLHKNRPPHRMPLGYTSPVVRFLIGEAKSKEAKALISASKSVPVGGAGQFSIFDKLTPSVRTKLLQVLATYKLGTPVGRRGSQGGRPYSARTADRPESASQSRRLSEAPDVSYVSPSAAQGTTPPRGLAPLVPSNPRSPDRCSHPMLPSGVS